MRDWFFKIVHSLFLKLFPQTFFFCELWSIIEEKIQGINRETGPSLSEWFLFLFLNYITIYRYLGLEVYHNPLNLTIKPMSGLQTCSPIWYWKWLIKFYIIKYLDKNNDNDEREKKKIVNIYISKNVKQEPLANSWKSEESIRNSSTLLITSDIVGDE